MIAWRKSWAAVTNVFTGVPHQPELQSAPPPSGAAGANDTYGNRLNVELMRRPGRLAAACLASVVGSAVIAEGDWMRTEPVAEIHAASDPLAGPVPVPVPGDRSSWLPLARRAAATCPGLSSAVLVAISSVESSLGLQNGPSSAGAVGPMQFLPETWAAYGVDGDGDALIDVMNPVDAVHGAARLLCANGGGDPERLASAVWNYNHSDDYVRRVIGLARLISTEVPAA
ncbi:MAG TPA: lytic transglycosylase domain-containing protein [Acidimicrobiales bacterium]|nr:lytic transglycosylase domain-containing protein [Acidimicrobiales bacterium]